jgi:hypothetical protein
MTTVNEFAINLPITSAGAVGMEVAPPPAPAPVDVTASYTLPADVDASSCDHIGVYMDSAQVMNYDPKSPTVLVDMVLSVSVTDPATGSTKNYKMVKRISMDKCKLACDAEHLTPVQVVEAEDDPVEVAKIMEEYYAAQRAREIAGLSEAAGTKAYTVLFKFDDESPAAMAALAKNPNLKQSASASVKIDHVNSPARARHVWGLKYGKHAKYPNAKITRVTEIK